MDGFAKIARGRNTCGIASCSTVPTNLIDPELDDKRPFQQVLHDINSTGAMCLDGSPAGLYYSKGFGSGLNKTVIFFQDGGWCYNLTVPDMKHDSELLLDWNCIARMMSFWGTTG